MMHFWRGLTFLLSRKLPYHRLFHFIFKLGNFCRVLLLMFRLFIIVVDVDVIVFFFLAILPHTREFNRKRDRRK